jgi:hypothetical protein
MRIQKHPIAAFAVILPLLLLCVWRHEAGCESQHHADGPATHNMVVIGESTVYLCHLPMFQDPEDLKKQPVQLMPHRYQAILEVTLDNQDKYVKDRQGPQAAKLYTLGPTEQFVLPELAQTRPGHSPLGAFNAKIYRGHLEKPGPHGEEVILRDVKITVKQAVYFREFDPQAVRPAHLEYLLFGKAGKFFLSHLIVAPPDFDQLLSVKFTGHRFADEELAKGVRVVFPATTNAPADRLRAKQRIAGEIKSGSRPTAKKLKIQVGEELYFEEGELSLPPDFSTTAEERKAGFP